MNTSATSASTINGRSSLEPLILCHVAVQILTKVRFLIALSLVLSSGILPLKIIIVFFPKQQWQPCYLMIYDFYRIEYQKRTYINILWSTYSRIIQKESPMLICIPDISGFMDFSQTNLALSTKINPSQLNKIIYFTKVGYKVSEIVGDTVLLFKMGKMPSSEALIDQCKMFYTEFYKQRDILLKLNKDASIPEILILNYPTLWIRYSPYPSCK